MDAPIKTALILADLPNKSFCGIDLLSFTTSTRFLGVKHIPLGWHFVYSAANDAFFLRRGAWFQFTSSSDLKIISWDTSNEELVSRSDPASRVEWEQRLPGIWRERLTPYRQSVPTPTVQNEIQDEEYQPIEEHNDWPQLTDCISSKLLTRITKSPSDAINHFPLTSASTARQDFDSIPGLSSSSNGVDAEGELGLIPINLKQTWRDGAVGRERTEAAMDRSWAFRQLVRDHCHGDTEEVLGELQLTFLMVLTLNNNSCLEQWKRILGLILTCTNAAIEESEFFVRFLGLLKLQLEHSLDARGGLFDLSEEGGSLLKGLLGRFRRGLERVDGMAKENVTDALDKLDEYLKAEHGWRLNTDYVRRGMLELEDGEQVEMDVGGADEEDESGEYAPTIVELTPDQLRQVSDRKNTSLSLNPKVRGKLTP